MSDGQVVTAQTSQVNERSNLVLNNFVEKWLYLSFNWTTDDLTVEIEKTKAKIPGNVYASTFAVTTTKDFRHQYIKQFAELIDKATVKSLQFNLPSALITFQKNLPRSKKDSGKSPWFLPGQDSIQATEKKYFKSLLTRNYV